jgi:hypothetical protein
MSADSFSRRAFVGVSATIAAGVLTKGDASSLSRIDDVHSRTHRPPPSAPLDDLTIADLQEGLAAGRYTARSLVEQYQARIESMDKQGPTLNHVLELNPDALTIADQRDAERKAGKTLGALHGIPILIKDFRSNNRKLVEVLEVVTVEVRNPRTVAAYTPPELTPQLREKRRSAALVRWARYRQPKAG